MSAVFLTRFESMEPLELNLSNYNPTFKGEPERHPTPFNKGGSFPCEPGQCVSLFEDYFGKYCGASSLVNQTCYNIDVSDIENALNEEVYVIDQNVSTVEEVRHDQ